MTGVTLDPPAEIVECARRLIEWAREQGLENWSVMGIGPRYIGKPYTPPAEPGRKGDIRIYDGHLWMWREGRWQDIA